MNVSSNQNLNNEENNLLNELELDYFHFLENNKMEEQLKKGFDKYKKIILDFIEECKKNEDINTQALFSNIITYLNKEYKNLNEERNINAIKIAEKYSDYLTFILIKNKFLLKKKFKNVLNELGKELKIRNGGKLINIQFKDLNLLIYIHS